jgi:2-aminoadipate transaminase
MVEQWSERWSRRGKLAAEASRRPRVAPEGMVSFNFGDPDGDSLPMDELAEAAEWLAEHRRRDALGYNDPIRGDELNESLSIKLKRDQGIDATPDQILVTAGSSNALSLLCDMVIDPGDVVLTDGPAWMGATGMFRLSGAESINIELDEDGLDPALVEHELDKLARQGRKPKFLYTIPTFQNPAGVETSLERRKGLAKLADERGLLILEDDAYYDLRFAGEPKPTIYSLAQPGNVLFFGTLSKTIAAGLRVGYMVGPADVVKAISRGRVDSLRNSFSAALADWYLRTGKLEEHIQELREIYRVKSRHMLAALEREMPEGTTWTHPNGGFFIWVTLPEGVNAVEILPTCIECGIEYIPGTGFYSDGRGEGNLRLSFSAVSPEQIDTGIARLAEQVRNAMQGSLTPA